MNISVTLMTLIAVTLGLSWPASGLTLVTNGPSLEWYFDIFSSNTIVVCVKSIPCITMDQHGGMRDLDWHILAMKWHKIW